MPFGTFVNAIIVSMFQRLLAFMLSWVMRQLTPSVSVKIESFHGGERFQPLRKVSYKRKSMRLYALLAYRLAWSCWSLPEALLCTSSVWRYQHSRVCVISGALENSETLSSHCSPASQAQKWPWTDWVGRWRTMKDVWSFSIPHRVSRRSTDKLLQ